VKRLSFRALLYWLAPTAGVGTLAGQVRTPVVTGVVVDTLAAIRSRYLPATPMVRVFLPPGYGQSRKRYPVLYANDGQDMEAVGLSRTIDSLVVARRMNPVIVVAIHAGEDRLQNYGTADQPNAQGLGSRAESYEKFMLRELIPAIERRYRTLPGRASIMGWSLGGLSAFDLAWRNGSTFQSVGVFSGSFWWRTDDSSAASKQSSRIMHRRVRESGQPPRLRAWFEVGRQDEKDDRDMNGVIDAIQDTRELIDVLVEKGFRTGNDLQYLEVEGGHNVETWGKELPQFLVWAFGSTR
jgi:enterochelin esterase-like enzyme